ncbi:MAG: flagellin [Oscillospiraceae bacterium]|nr:flagellin [Oscillospiraceae bacterium]
MRIQHNIAAMNAYRNYNINTSAVSKNLEKLSSGYKINRAGDDAAGLAISEKMRAQITGLNAASKNAKDGVSLVKTAEGALQEVHDMLNRMVNLATQSANGTYDNEVDRANLQKEVDQLKAEINRIADSSNFNGINLLDGSMQSKTVASGLTDVTLENFKDGQLASDPKGGVYQIDFSQCELINATDADVTDFTVTIGGTDLTISKSIVAGGRLDGASIAQAVANAMKDENAGGANGGNGYFADGDGNEYEISVNGGVLTMTMREPPATAPTADMSVKVADGANLSNNGEEAAVTVLQEPVSKDKQRIFGQATMTLEDTQVTDGTAIKIGDTTYVFAVGSNSAHKNAANVIDLTDYKEGTEGLSNIAANRLTAAALNNKNFYVGTDATMGDTSAVLTFTEKEGGVDYEINDLSGGDNQSDALGGTNTATAEAKHWRGLVQMGIIDTNASTRGLRLQIGDTAASYNQLIVNIEDCHTKSLGLDGVTVATQEGAAKAIESIKTAINSVSSIRGTLGATQNRLEHTQNNLSVMKENIQDAESTIRDTDVAEEMMSYTKNNILVQSAQAMLAQANQIPQGVLQLLG